MNNERIVIITSVQACGCRLLVCGGSVAQHGPPPVLSVAWEKVARVIVNDSVNGCEHERSNARQIK